MKTKLFLAGLTFCFAGSIAQAQHWCGTDHAQDEFYQSNPEQYKKDSETKERLFEEARLSRERHQLGFRKNNNNALGKQAQADGEYRIPVVVHVMHQDGPENISYEQIVDQLRIMNEDFARENPDAGNTPAPFISIQDSLQVLFSQNELSAYTAQNAMLTFQNGTADEDTDGQGDRFTFYFTDADNPDAPDYANSLPNGDIIDYTGAANLQDSIDLALGTIIPMDVTALGNRVGLAKAISAELNGTGQFNTTVEIDGTKENNVLTVNGTSLDILTQQQAYVTVYDGGNQAHNFYFTTTENNAAPTGTVGFNTEVNLDGLSTTAEIAAALHTAILTFDDFDASISGNEITIINNLEGDSDGVNPNGLLSTSFSVTNVEEGTINDEGATVADSDDIPGVQMIVDNGSNGAATQQVTNLSSAIEIRETMKGGFIAATTGIKFELAKIDPDGNCTNGVNRVLTRKTVGARNNVKGLIQWDPHKYLNIWIVESIEAFTNDGGTTLGFAQFPEQLASSPETDGLVIIYDYLGSIEEANGRVGRTATHEIGHWLGLRHIWGDDDFSADGEQLPIDPYEGFSTAELEQVCGGDDGVEDTPLQDTRNYGNPEFPRKSECHDLWFGDMFMNYMDYVDDSSMNAFSNGQEAVMVNVLETIRTEIWSAENLAATGLTNFDEDACTPYIADFDSNKKWLCEGENVKFTPEAFYTDGADFTWTLLGSDEPTSTTLSPTVSYDTPGYYPVELKVSNANGETIKRKQQMIHVVPDETALDAPLTEGFAQWQFPNIDGKPFFASHMDENNPDNSWQYYGGANGTYSADQQGALRVRTKYFDNEEPRYLVFPNVDLSSINGSTIDLYFEYAYAKHNLNTSDFIDVRLISDCDNFRIPSGGAGDLIRDFSTDDDHTVTNGGANVFFDFVPTDDEWASAHMRFNVSGGAKSNVMLYFEIYGDNGNYFYIDNISIGTGLGLEDVITPATLGLQVYPNPTTDDATISFQLNSDADVAVSLYDVIGKEVGSIAKTLGAQQHDIKLSEISSNLKAGVYFVQLNVNGVLTTEKIVISE